MSTVTKDTLKSRVTVTAKNLALTLNEAKQQVNWPADDTSSDNKISQIVERATAEFENDTGYCLITRTLEVSMVDFKEIRFYERPVRAISSIQYYDAFDALQTWPTSNYSLDLARNQVRFRRNYTTPAVSDRWDAVKITYTAGFGDEAKQVPQQFKQPVLLLVGYYLENPDMMNNYGKGAYEALVNKLQRSSYP